MEKHKILVSKVGIDFRGKPQIRGESASHGWISSAERQTADHRQGRGGADRRTRSAFGRHSACGIRVWKRSNHRFDDLDEHCDRAVRACPAMGTSSADCLPRGEFEER